MPPFPSHTRKLKYSPPHSTLFRSTPESPARPPTPGYEISQILFYCFTDQITSDDTKPDY